MLILWLAVVLALLFAYWFLIKMTHPYQGRHHYNRVATVPQTYHPSDSAWVAVPVKNRAWWDARMTRLRKVDFLALPIPELLERSAAKAEALVEEAKSWLARDYRWMDIPLAEWPKAWLERQAHVIELPVKIGGSDLPTRANEMNWSVAA